SLADQGITETEIHIGIWGPLTGPAALWGDVARGVKCYFDMINSEGGIHGRKIVYYLRDDGYIPARTMAIAKDLVENKGVFAFASGVGTSCGMAVQSYLDKNKIIWVGPASGSTHWAYPPTPYLFSTYSLFCDEAAILVNYAINSLFKKKIAFFYQNDDYGKSGLYGAQIALEKQGSKLVAEVPVESTETNIESHYAKLAENAPDCIIMFVNPKHAAVILKISDEKGLKVQWMTSTTLGDLKTMYDITRGLFKNVISPAGFAPEISPVELIQKYKKAHDEFAKNERFGTFFMGGIYLIEPMIEAFKRCGRDLNRENFVKAMESIKNFRALGGEISFAPSERQGLRSVFLVKCGEDGKTDKLTDNITSDIDVAEVIKRLSQ
ncbi:MAG: ABC transporter substrate-binding protein, partial [Desulfobacterales bacterium]|nr:ABC transporter substrate-binding protein [Desulfobacterales bacterium]